MTLLMRKDDLFPIYGVTVSILGKGKSFHALFIVNQRLFLEKKNQHLYKLCFLRHPAELLNSSVLDFCRLPSFCLLTIC